MPSVAFCFLSLGALLVIVDGSTLSQENVDDSMRLAHKSQRNPLSLLLRKRALESAIRAPRPYGYYEPALLDAPSKREEDFWIWMPAHGYMPVPKEEYKEESNHGRDSMGNLFRYG